MYGFEVINNLGETVISSETPVYHFFNEFTVSPFESGSNIFAVPRDSPRDLHFYRFPVNAEVGYITMASATGIEGTDSIYSNLSQLTVRVYRPISEYVSPSPDGYGLEVYNSSGDVTFTSKIELLACDIGVVDAFGNRTEIGNSEWISPAIPVLYEVEDQNVYFNYANVLQRTSLTKVRQKAVFLRSSPFASTTVFTSPWDMGALWF